jgi:3-deoxy-D-manno-octulosonic-acid transferase
MGDARFDQVWKRAYESRDPPDPIADLADGEGPTIVAGSTWPADEDLLVPALERLSRRGLTFRLVIAPHEPTADHLARLEGRLKEHSLDAVRLRRIGEGAGAPVVVVDRIGILGDLYRLADVAYVGGGFGTAGLHSILEPAAFGVPVLFGPRHSNAREASELVATGGAMTVADGHALEGGLRTWLTEQDRRVEAGRIARDFVERGLGAADRGVDLLVSLLDARTERQGKIEL